MIETVPVPLRVYEGTAAKIKKLERDLLDARAALRLLLADVREVRENEPGERMIPTQHQVSDLRVARAAGGGEDE
jgi:hypothetical protein